MLLSVHIIARVSPSIVLVKQKQKTKQKTKQQRLLAFQNKISIHKRFKIMLFIRTKHNKLFLCFVPIYSVMLKLLCVWI